MNNLFKKPQLGLLSSLFFVFCTINAQEPETSAPLKTAQSKSSEPIILTCPDLPELSLDPASKRWQVPNWQADGQWTSPDPSFAVQIKQFLGARWQGVEIGQIICIYQGSGAYSDNVFPISLYYNTYVYQPNLKDPRAQNWQENSSNGTFNCYAKEVRNCPFQVRVKNPAPDLYDELFNLKKNSNKTTS